MPKEFSRGQRVAEQVRRELAELIRLLGGCSRDQRHQLITQLQPLPSA